ncbi:GH36-type glycosyl hydrolase domain-containing protein [Halotalea alkalilenta]|uniref:Glycosyl transferase n=1 Tax=Halotalea alkalilenta TaxID=376489 RepID=A0A172YCJ7_9GAMM|nr:glucoamylase family protein [Halotalea alkalilenta]ANF56832.1 glycosyl transferase [Halotalea alkalilenta]
MDRFSLTATVRAWQRKSWGEAHHSRRPASAKPPWNDEAPIREELFSTERLEQHGQSLAIAQSVMARPPPVLPLQARLEDNAGQLLSTYRASATEIQQGRTIVPAAKWLLDNFSLIEIQINEVRADLPPGYYRQLPKLAEGPFIGYPRVFGIAWAFVAHTDSQFDPEALTRFVAAYQREVPLTIGELWALAITLRIVLLENLRRLADQITSGRKARAAADALADQLLDPTQASAAFAQEISLHEGRRLSERFAAQLAKRLRGQDPNEMPALGWLDERLGRQGSSVELAVQHAQQRLGASYVSVRNVITSMRAISGVDWSALFERMSLVDARLREHGGFAEMDFPTRDTYRGAIESLARGSAQSELKIVEQVLEASQRQADDDPARSDPGYHLLAEGRKALEQRIGFRPPLYLRARRVALNLGITGYVGALALLTLAWVGFAIWGLSALGVGPAWWLPFALLGLLPASEVATAVVNRAVASGLAHRALPELELKDGIPPQLRTLVAVPTLLTTSTDLLEQIGRLEVHHLASAGGELYYALLVDGTDADRETLEDESIILATAVDEIRRLNLRHGPGPSGSRFLLLRRRRIFNPSEQRWMGWERKRGKLHELNRLLRGATDTSFVLDAANDERLPSGVRFVITLDVDTRLPRDAAQRLIGKMAHPLNRARFSQDQQRIERGYAILQPRVTPELTDASQGSIYQRVFSAPGGMDPYASAISDVYQDLFGEGSFIGKGIYDVDAVEAALHGRVPDNTLLSHDLFEGIFARAGIASDIELVEAFPSRYDVDAKRQHRWIRGDWQLLPWAFGRGLAPIGRWKMLDNLRRSLIAPMMLACLGLSWLLPLPAAALGVAWLLAAIMIPIALPSLSAVMPPRTAVSVRHHLTILGGELGFAALRAVLSAILLADRAWRAVDAIVRTLIRLFVTHSHLLEWTTSAHTQSRARPNLVEQYRQMAGGAALGLSITVVALAWTPSSWPLALPFLLGWLIAPAAAWWASRTPARRRELEVSALVRRDLRRIARRTWRYFETFVTAESHNLPPDNFQQMPKAVVAHRTSPTNIGLYLLSAVTARDYGWSGTLETIERVEKTFDTLHGLARHRGHLFNWYETRTLAPLAPAYVSTVDSGNLAGHLIALANACTEWHRPVSPVEIRHALEDALALARTSLSAQVTANHGAEEIDDRESELRSAAEARLVAALDAFELDLGQLRADDQTPWPLLAQRADSACEAAHRLAAYGDDGAAEDVRFWVEALRRRLIERERDRHHCSDPPKALERRLGRLADTARAFALEMDFAFLFDTERELFSIGYSVASDELDPSRYDLLASEARLASLFAIAKGDAPTRHWFRLGRRAIPIGGGVALISWSGSMFEYLMPSLVLRDSLGSLLEQSNRWMVSRQAQYGHAHGVPWGISESAYNARDIEFTYQYSNFGVPSLGLNRGLSDNLVIAPYATGLATMVDPRGAHRNYQRLAALGALGRYGFFEALDFTRTRVPEGEKVAIVGSFMAHHQGMTIVAIANALDGGRMRDRFHREPMIQATELLLQERVPREVVIERARAEALEISAGAAGQDTPVVRRHVAPVPGAPLTHLLSNGRYAVMLTSTSAGYSRWRELAVTRWREDPTRDELGTFVFLRDIREQRVWSAGGHVWGRDKAQRKVVFAEDQASFEHRAHGLTTVLEVMVSGEDDAEVRRLSVTNTSRHSRELELTSYAEVVLALPAADAAHPAFSKMFVETEHLADSGALIATRRPRAANEQRVWAGHFAVMEGKPSAPPQYESDRRRFIGRGRGLSSALAIVEGQPLSGTVGTVLDPIFSLRRRIEIPPGKVARISFWTVVASTREELLGLIDKHHDRSAFARARTLAWTQAQVQLRHLDIDSEEAADFQRLAAPIVYPDARFRAPVATIALGIDKQSELWAHGISGDLPIVLLHIDDIEDIAQVRQLLRAHEYWRMKRLDVDLVIVNERTSSYMQELQIAIEVAVRRSQSRPRVEEPMARGEVHALRADMLSAAFQAQLRACARVSLMARSGPIGDQLLRIVAPPRRLPPVPRCKPKLEPTRQRPIVQSQALEFFNGLGGFDRNGLEYVTILADGRTTPAPWINVIANPGFGFQVSAEGSGYTWAESSRENQLTPWSNDPVEDPAGEALYLRDEHDRTLWCATARPIRNTGVYVARHGFGYSSFEHEAHGIGSTLLQFVPLHDPIKVSRLTLRNLSSTRRRISVTSYAQWLLGASSGTSAPFIVTECEASTGALLARNRWSIPFSSRVAFADLGGRQSSWTADRTEFLGRNSGPDAPAALLGNAPLSGTLGAGLDPCAVLQCVIELEVGESVEVVSLLGQSDSADEARALILRYREADLDASLEEVSDDWRRLFATTQVQTPDRAMDILLNGWLPYQTRACRLTARSAFYQASGAYGFRDQLQDRMSLMLAEPEQARAHILRAASRQFPEGDVQHWWLPHSGQGVRTRISDDRVWLAFATASYIGCTNDVAILDETLAFLDGPELGEDEHEAFFQPTIAEQSASLFEHCARALDQSIALTGQNRIPLIGTGDWNDSMNRVGVGGKGESVWLGWLLITAIELLLPYAEVRDPARAARWKNHANTVREAIERRGWDGEWYRRGTFDDGRWFGSAASEECRIDSIAQSWAVLSGAADPRRAREAMASVGRHLVRHDDGIALLFTPPFDATALDPGYIKGYPPGLRENGGQYTHAAIWAVLAYCRLGEAAKASELFSLLNPINHALTPEATERYKVEPYVIAADVYAVAPHVGRGGWTWYTGAAGWMYRAGIEGILGIHRKGDRLVVAPCIPPTWPGFTATLRIASTSYEVEVSRQKSDARHSAQLDGQSIACVHGRVSAPLDGGDHRLAIVLPEESE